MPENSCFTYLGIVAKKLSKDDLEKHVKLAKQGNEDSFNKILGHKHSYIRHMMREFFIQGSEPIDVYQECAIKLINIIEKYDDEKGSFDAFANSSIRKHIITNINKEKAKKRRVLNDCYSLNDETKNEEGESVTFMDTVTENLENQNTTKNILMDIVQKDHEEFLVENISDVLSEMESKVFVLRYIEHYSYKEIAKQLGFYKIDPKLNVKILDQKAVDNAIWRSKPKIKKILEKLGLNSSELLRGSKKSGLGKKRIKANKKGEKSYAKDYKKV